MCVTLSLSTFWSLQIRLPNPATGGARSIDVTEMIQAFDWDDNELDADSYITPIDGASQGDS